MKGGDERKQSKIDELMTRRKLIKRKHKLETEDENELEQIEREITHEIADREFDKLNKILGNLETDTNSNVWKEMRKAFPNKKKPLPTGVLNAQGKLITNPKEKKSDVGTFFK